MHLRALVMIACAGLLVGCAASIPPAELIDARQAYQHATVGLAATLTPAELYKAQEALAAAESSFRNDPTSARTRDLAYVAERKAMLAEVLASSTARKAATIKAKHDYQTTLNAIQTKKVITEAIRNAAAKVEQSSLPGRKEAGLATKRGPQTLNRSRLMLGQGLAVGSTPVIKEPRQKVDPQSPGGKRTARILLVEDDRNRSESVRRILKSPDYQVVEAADCDNAIDLLGNRMFDLILLGFTLPSEGSIRVLESLKQYQLTTRVIVIKEAPGLESAVKAATLAARGYITVP